MHKKNSSEFAARRALLRQRLGNNTLAILSNAPKAYRNADSEYLYRPDSDFYYLTGFPEPNAIALILPERFVLFNQASDKTEEIWTGKKVGQIAGCEEYGADEAYSIKEFTQRLPDFLKTYSSVHFPFGKNPSLEQCLKEAMSLLQKKLRQGIHPPSQLIDLKPIIHELRLIKSPLEIEYMRKAAEISAAAHIRAMKACRPGIYEYVLEAEMMYEFYRNGSRAPAYTSIVGAGKNSCTLHYTDNRDQLKAGEVVLIDAACEYECYASDITRTLPINGEFSHEQSAVYQLVLKAQLAGIKAAQPMQSWDAIQKAIINILVEGLIELGILKGDRQTLIEKEAYFPFYMHNSGHWLGLDVHDPSSYKQQGEWRKLVPGMVFTIEPGLYIAENSEGVDPKWWNIGVRIEDDILMTASGPEVLSAGVPKEITEIYQVMKR